MTIDYAYLKSRYGLSPEDWEQYCKLLEQGIARDNRQGKHRTFGGYATMTPQPGDDRALVDEYNRTVRAFNAYGGQGGQIIQGAVDVNAREKIVGDWGEAYALWVERRLFGPDKILKEVQQDLDDIFKRMEKLERGPDGIHELADRIGRPPRRTTGHGTPELRAWLERQGLEY